MTIDPIHVVLLVLAIVSALLYKHFKVVLARRRRIWIEAKHLTDPSEEE